MTVSVCVSVHSHISKTTMSTLREIFPMPTCYL